MADTSIFFDVRPDEGLRISCDGQAEVCVQVLHKNGRASRLRVTAPAAVKVNRVSATQPEEDWLTKGAAVVPSTAA